MHLDNRQIMETLKFTKVRDVKTPERGTKYSAGIDFFVPNDFKSVALLPSSDILIPSGIKAKIPHGFMLMCADKSGIAVSKSALQRANLPIKEGKNRPSIIVGAKIVDEDYQGEIHIHIINVGYNAVIIEPGMKIVQFILVPVNYCQLEEVEEDKLFSEQTERGDGGFGSTNK